MLPAFAAQVIDTLGDDIQASVPAMSQEYLSSSHDHSTLESMQPVTECAYLKIYRPTQTPPRQETSYLLKRDISHTCGIVHCALRAYSRIR